MEIGLFAIVSESSIASGTRRKEAVTGKAYYYLQEFVEVARAAAVKLNAHLGIPAAVDRIANEMRLANQKIESLSRQLMGQKLGDVTGAKESVNGVDILVQDLGQASKEDLLNAWDQIKRQGSCMAFLFSSKNKLYICAATDDVVANGVSCKKFINFAAGLGIKGGGRDNVAQGVMQDINAENIKDALKKFLQG